MAYLSTSNKGDSTSEPLPSRDKDERAIEKLVFLKLREPSPTVGSLVACGAGGWVQFWNTTGGGLVGEYNVWDTRRHSLPLAERGLHSVTALHVNETETVLYTGNSLGYIQVWDICDYCLDSGCRETTPTVKKTTPPLKLAWRSHLLSIVSIDTAEEGGVVITASTDCTVRLWTLKGFYIGTFGQRVAWQLPLPPPGPRGPNIFPLIPPDLHRSSSIETLHTISGAIKSKWILAKILLRILRTKGPSGTSGHHDDQTPPLEDVLGRCYKRRTRVRRLIERQPLRQREFGTFSIYTSLTCPERTDSLPIPRPARVQSASGGFPSGVKGHHDVTPPTSGAGPKEGGHTHTEASLLQGVWQRQRRMTAI
jgi:WD40 repeat protein